MNLYVVRHGRTVWNEKGITQGQTNNRLSSTGINQIKETSKNLKDIKFDIIICSPLMRTVQTANLLNVYHNIKIIKDKRLIDINQGIFSGRKFDSLTNEELKLKSSCSKECGMENFEEVFCRIKKFLQNVKKDYTYNNVLIVTHSCIATIMENIIENKIVDYKKNNLIINFNNAEVKKFII